METLALRTLELLAAAFAVVATGLVWAWRRNSRGWTSPDIKKPREQPSDYDSHDIPMVGG